jgi:hypothetical protein
LVKRAVKDVHHILEGMRVVIRKVDLRSAGGAQTLAFGEFALEKSFEAL